jgi:hypothetical protein
VGFEPFFNSTNLSVRGKPPIVNQAELHLFYEDLVRKLRAQGVVCAITSGLACVHYGVAETTKDCDLLCHSGSFDVLLERLAATRVEGRVCGYRGNISPPLDARWHAGGWTSHFEWAGGGVPAVTLDVFGHALRESAPWAEQSLGLYAGPQTVAEMKRTNRDKDWPFITALGVRMIEADDERGWLHIFDEGILTELLRSYQCTPAMVARRPALRLALDQDPRTPGALNAERKLWEELDRRRIHILEGHLRPYVLAVRKARHGQELSLRQEHEVRIECAARCLPANPLKDYGLVRYVYEAKQALVDSEVIPPTALTWLPDVTIYFEWLNK